MATSDPSEPDPSRGRRALDWLRARDRNFAALRRAGRAAIVMPSLFALTDQALGNPAVSTFAVFGTFALLVLVEFGGPLRDRLLAQCALAVTGGTFVCLGTLASRTTWLAALAMAVAGFAVIFSGVVSSVLASASVSLLLAFILPVSLPGSASTIPDRLEGWALASGVSLLAVWLLWPTPARDPLRSAAIAACRALARRLRADADLLLGDGGADEEARHAEAVAAADAALQTLRETFFSLPARPTGLTTETRATVRLVDELAWLSAIAARRTARVAGLPVNRAACAVRTAVAVALDRSADLLEAPRASPDELRAALDELADAVATAERASTIELPARWASAGTSDVVSALDPGFRAQELSYAASQIAANAGIAAAAERRSWGDRLLGRQPAGLAGPLTAAQQRLTAHLERHSVWLHNSVRGAAGLAAAVVVANASGVQHAFWVVLGTLSVLRSNALSTGQNVLRGIVGTTAGFVLGAGLLAAVGTSPTVLWILLPPAVLLAGFAPAAISFAAGQAAFTLTLVIVFNILQPAGWRVGLLRVEDVAIGCAVSLVVGALFWPRGAAVALGQELAEAYGDSARYLAAAVEYGVACCDRGVPRRAAPTADSLRAAAAARRLDDAFRTYLTENGAKPVPLAEVASLVTGVVGLRLAADAVLDLWQRDGGRSAGDRAAASRELNASAEIVVGWYEDFAAALEGARDLPEPLPRDALGDHRLLDAVRSDLAGRDGRASDVAVRVIWTGDHLDAARRLQEALLEPARAATTRRAFRPAAPRLLLRAPRLARS
ncbi:MAG TPA: FUSC family protein [Gaiellaceae bacterium]|nr:FUSC family protein [Gaiellaceae bacterium]